MGGLCERFAPLMAETLRLAGAPDGLALPLSEANARIVGLAEEERAASYGFADSAERRGLGQARLAVAAWADEQMQSSPRADAASWAAMSLQFRYFGTAEAGRLFYQELEKCLDSCGAPRRAKIRRDKAAEDDDDEERLGFGGENAEAELWRELDLAERLEAAAAMELDGEDLDVLRIFALCLLYGFRGALYGDTALLSRVRRACRPLFVREPRPAAPPARRRTKSLFFAAERVAFVLLPILVCVIFALYCGSVLANAPFRGGF